MATYLFLEINSLLARSFIAQEREAKKVSNCCKQDLHNQSTVEDLTKEFLKQHKVSSGLLFSLLLMVKMIILELLLPSKQLT